MTGKSGTGKKNAFSFICQREAQTNQWAEDLHPELWYTGSVVDELNGGSQHCLDETGSIEGTRVKGIPHGEYDASGRRW